MGYKNTRMLYIQIIDRFSGASKINHKSTEEYEQNVQNDVQALLSLTLMVKTSYIHTHTQYTKYTSSLLKHNQPAWVSCTL